MNRCTLRPAIAAGILWLACTAVVRTDAADGVDTAADDANAPRNLILMIADGAGYNSWKATAMYEGLSTEEFPGAQGWHRLAVSTYALRSGISAPVDAAQADVQLPMLRYDPQRAWDATIVEGGPASFPYRFEGYRWLRESAPDSASTMTAIVTGRKTYNGSINFDGAGRPIEQTLARLAADSGRKVGAISSVYWTDATPAAAAGARQASRGSMCRIAIQMLTSAHLKLIAGAGNPDFDNNGRPLGARQARHFGPVGGAEIWALLKHGRRPGVGTTVCAEGLEDSGVQLTAAQIEAIARWTLIEDRETIRQLARGAAPPHLLLVPSVGSRTLWSGAPAADGQPFAIRVGGSLHQTRGSATDARFTAPGDDSLLPAVPTLEELTRASLNALDDTPAGFFLTIEGGAIDWAMHDNQFGRMIEEMQDFKRSLATVVAWVEANGGWERNLLVVTSDHDHMLWGPEADTVAFDPLVDNGAGALPSYRWLSDHHSSALVPLIARGDGANGFVALKKGKDPFRGDYIDQTDLFAVMKRFLAARP